MHWVTALGWRRIPLLRTAAGAVDPFPGWTGYRRADLPWPATGVVGEALGVPDNAVMIDVDHYGSKRGADTLARAVAELGPLPPTVRITARGPGDPGGRLPYRVPAEWRASEAKFNRYGCPGDGGRTETDIEIVQRHHRFSWAPGMIHGKTGTMVKVYAPDGTVTGLPYPGQLPELPPAWLAFLAAEPAGTTGGYDGDLAELLEWDAGVPVYLDEFTADPGGGYRDDWIVRGTKEVATAVLGKMPAGTGEAFDAMYAVDPDKTERLLRGSLGWQPPGSEAVSVAAEAVQPVPVPVPAVGGFAGMDPDDFFGKTGLLAVTVAQAVEAMGRLGAGNDHWTWKYSGGVWVQDKNAVADRVVALLDNRHRKSHTATVEEVIAARCRARGDTITAEPVPEFINVVNGLLHWQTGQLHPHSPEVRSTVQLAVSWDPAAVCARFDRWLEQVVPADCITLVWEVIAYLVFSGNPFHKAVMLDGTGRNGKGTFLRTLEGIIGNRNISAVSLKDLTDNRFAAAGLLGKLANIAGDIDGTYLESTARFKAITGGDLITAEHKGRDAFKFVPWAVPVFSANKVPAAADTSAGYLSRWVVLPFPNSFEGREDRQLDAMIAAEYPGIFAKAVGHLAGLLDRGNFSLPPSAAAAKAKFERTVDPVRAWRDECTTEGGWAERGLLFHSYETWIGEERRWKLSRSAFYERLGNLQGMRDAVVHGSRGFNGVTLPPPVQPGPRP